MLRKRLTFFGDKVMARQACMFEQLEIGVYTSGGKASRLSRKRLRSLNACFGLASGMREMIPLPVGKSGDAEHDRGWGAHGSALKWWRVEFGKTRG